MILEPDENTTLDGRVRRGVRNRGAIVDAVFALLAEGAEQPTAREIAERAGVQPRTVFRHFEDMASLTAEVIERLRAEMLPVLHEGPYEGSLEERVSAMARVRSRIYERLAPFHRAGNALRSRYEIVQADHESSVLELRRNLQVVFPELRTATPQVAQALECLTSIEAWERLRFEQGLSVNAARRAVETGALSILDAARRAGRG